MFLTAIGEIIVYVDGMNGLIRCSEVIEWLYSLLESKVLLHSVGNGVLFTAIPCTYLAYTVCVPVFTHSEGVSMWCCTNNWINIGVNPNVRV